MKEAGKGKTKAQRQKKKTKQTKQLQKNKCQSCKNTIKPSTVYAQLSTLHDSHRLRCWKEGTQENSVDVEHPETGAVIVGAAETFQNGGKMKVQS